MCAEKRYIDLLHKDLSYKIRGCAFNVRKQYGIGHKEIIYQNAFHEELETNKIPYKREPSINISSIKTGKILGVYRPDFLIGGKVIVELKALECIPKVEINKFYTYLRNTKYELGFLINYGGEKLNIKRVIYSNKLKEHPVEIE